MLSIYKETHLNHLNKVTMHFTNEKLVSLHVRTRGVIVLGDYDELIFNM